MPNSAVYEVEISTQQRGLMDTRQKHKKRMWDGVMRVHEWMSDAHLWKSRIHEG